MILLRQMLGDALRRLRLRQGRTLREVSAVAKVSLGYLSEVERGQKEASSELLASICGALGAPLSQVLREVSDSIALAELQSEPAFALPVEPLVPVGGQPGGADGSRSGAPPVPRRDPAGASARAPQHGNDRLVMAAPQGRITVHGARRLARADHLLEPVAVPGGEPEFDTLARDITTTMVPV